MNASSPLNTQITERGLIRGGFVSVGHWEHPIQVALVEEAIWKEGLRVLEIGYGLGMAATAIRERVPARHVVFESDPLVAAAARTTLSGTDVELVVAGWRSACSHFGHAAFDAVIFDPDPDTPAELGWGIADIFNWVSPGIRLLHGYLARPARLGFIDFSNEIARYTPFLELAREVGAAIHERPCSALPYAGCCYSQSGESTVVTLRWIL